MSVGSQGVIYNQIELKAEPVMEVPLHTPTRFDDSCTILGPVPLASSLRAVRMDTPASSAHSRRRSTWASSSVGGGGLRRCLRLRIDISGQSP